MTAEELLELVRGEFPPAVLRQVSRGLMLSGWAMAPLPCLGRALRYEASGSHDLAAIMLRVALREIARDSDLCVRLGSVDEPPWPWVLAAALAVPDE